MNYLELLKLAAPETIVVLARFWCWRRTWLRCAGWMFRFGSSSAGLIAAGGCIGAIAWMLVSNGEANLFNGMLVVDPLTRIVKVVILALTVFTILPLDGFGVHESPGRIPRARAAGIGPG